MYNIKAGCPLGSMLIAFLADNVLHFHPIAHICGVSIILQLLSRLDKLLLYI